MQLLINTGENSGLYTITAINTSIKLIEIDSIFKNFTMPEHIENFTILGNTVSINLD